MQYQVLNNWLGREDSNLRLRSRNRNGTGKLEEAVLAYREALKEYTRERVPLDWAMTR
jgi:hypothetical protein